MDTDVGSAPLHVLDLPQMYQKPSSATLQNILVNLMIEAPSFSKSTAPHEFDYIQPEGVTGYLTNIISSSLAWIEDENEREQIWDLASRRLSERAGRTAMGDFNRTFIVPRGPGYGDIQIGLHEPALTEDNLGFKTWSSSFVLAARLRLYDLPTLISQNRIKMSWSILELGSGTGLLGIAAALLWRKEVVLTDLPAIVPNLQHNIALNRTLLDENSAAARCEPLDWALEPDYINAELRGQNDGHAKIILVADPIYSHEHPRLLVNTIRSRLSQDEDARLLMAYPLREAYEHQYLELRGHLHAAGLSILEEALEQTQDDWSDEVTCCCSVWGWSSNSSSSSLHSSQIIGS